MDDNRRLILAVAYDEENGRYVVDVSQGSNVAESAFAMMVVIKCFLKDGLIKEADDVLSLIEKYLNDPQYEEVKDEPTKETENESGK